MFEMKTVIQFVFILCSYNVFGQVTIDSTKTIEQNFEKYFHPAYIYGNIIPGSLDEAVIILLHDSTKYSAKAEKCVFKGECASDLRRKWGLGRESVLTHYFNQVNIYDLETMERCIFELYHSYLRTGIYNEHLIIKINYSRNKKAEIKAKRVHQKGSKKLLKERVKRVKEKNKRRNNRKENMHPFFID